MTRADLCELLDRLRLRSRVLHLSWDPKGWDEKRIECSKRREASSALIGRLEKTRTICITDQNWTSKVLRAFSRAWSQLRALRCVPSGSLMEKNPRHFDIHTWTDQCSRLCTDNCLTSAANVTLLIGTTFLYMDTLAPQPATKMLVLSVYHNLPSCPMKNWYTRGDSYED